MLRVYRFRVRYGALGFRVGVQDFSRLGLRSLGCLECRSLAVQGRSVGFRILGDD